MKKTRHIIQNKRLLEVSNFLIEEKKLFFIIFLYNKMSSITIDDAQNYEIKSKVVGNYRISKLIPISGGQTFPIPLASGTTQTQFEIVGNNVVNFKESRLVWNTTMSGDATMATNNYCTWADPFCDFSDFSDF